MECQRTLYDVRPESANCCDGTFLDPRKTDNTDKTEGENSGNLASERSWTASSVSKSKEFDFSLQNSRVLHVATLARRDNSRTGRRLVQTKLGEFSLISIGFSRTWRSNWVMR
jgi:hypothetical protein